MSSTAKTGAPATPSSSSTTRDESWRGSSDALLDAFETLLQEGDLSYNVKRQSGGKWSSEELLSSCQTLLDDARDVVLSVESPGDSSSKRIKSWLKQSPPLQDASKGRSAQINYILGPSRSLPGHQQRKSQVFEHNIDKLFGDVEVECDSGRGTKSITNTTTTGSSNAITRPRSLGELSDTDSYSSFESYDRFDPEEVLVSDSEDDCFLEFETCISGSEEESELMTDDRFSLIDTGNEGDVEETSTDAGSNYSMITTSAEDLWQYNPSYGDTSSPSTMSPGLLTPPSLELSKGSSDETLRALSALGSNSSIENTASLDNTPQTKDNTKDVLVASNFPLEATVTATSPAALKQVDLPRGIQGVPTQPQGLPSPRTDDGGSTALSRAQPTSTDSVRVPSSTRGPCTTATVASDARMPQQVVPQGGRVASDKDARACDGSVSSAGGVVRPHPLRTVSATVPVEPPRREQQHQKPPPPPSGFADVTAPSSVAAANVPRHWSNTIANLPHADSEVDFLDHSEDMADIFGGDTSTLKRKQHRDTVLFNEEFKNQAYVQESHVIAPLNEVFGHFRYSDGYEDDSLAYANVLVVNRTPVEEMEAAVVMSSSAPREEAAAARILRGRRPAPQPPATPTPPQTPPPQSPNKPAHLHKATSAASRCKSPVGTPIPGQRISSRASTPGRNSPYSWVRLGPKRPAPLPPVFLPCKKAPAPPPPTGESNTLKKKQNKVHHMKPVSNDFRMGSDIQIPPGAPGIGASSGSRPNNTAHTPTAAQPAAQVKDENNIQRTKATGTAQNQDYSDIYSDLYGFKYQSGDIKSKNMKKSKGHIRDKNKIYSKLCSSGDNFEGPMFGGDGSVVTKLGDEDFLVKTVNGEEFLVTSIGGDEYLVSNVNMDKDESKKTVEDISIFKNNDGVFTLKDKDVTKSSSKKRVNKHGLKSNKSNSSGSEFSVGQSSDSSYKDCQESSSSGGHSVEGTSSSSGDAARGSVTEGTHSRSAVATAPSAAAPAYQAHSTAATMPTQNQKVYDKQKIGETYEQVPNENIRTVENKPLFNDKSQENVNFSNATNKDKCENLNKKSDYVTTIYVQDVEIPTGTDMGPVRNYGTVRATTVNTSNQGTPKLRNKNLNTNEARHSKSCGEVVVHIDALSSKGSAAGISSRVPSSSSDTVTVVAGQGGGVPPPSPCDSSECQVPSAAGALTAEARRGRPSDEHDAVRAARDAPSQQRPHAAPHTIGYATLLLGEDPHLWNYPVFGTVEQCQAELSQPTQEWALVVQGRGWGIVPSGDSDLVLKYSDTMDGMHARHSNHIIDANVNGLDNMTKTNQIMDNSAVHTGANNINGISERHGNESDADLSVHGFQLVQSDFGVVNNLLPVFDPLLCSPVRDDMSGAVTYRAKPDHTWHQDSRAKRNSDICDMTMYRDPPLLPDAGGGGGSSSGEMTPATSSRSIRLCGVALGAPLISSYDANPFRRHTLPRKARMSSLPPGPEDSSTTPLPPPAGISAPSSPKIGKTPVPFFPCQQQFQLRPDSLCIDSATTTPTNISPVSTPSQDSGCTTPTESCAYATPPGGSPATTPTSDSSAYVTAAEVIIHDANENMINMTYPTDCDLLRNNKQNVMNRLGEIDSNLEIVNSKRTQSIETSPITSVYANKENNIEFNPIIPRSELISPEPPPPDIPTVPHTGSVAATTQNLVNNENCSSRSVENITHAAPNHLPQSVLESTINTLESEKSLAVKCIHGSSSNLCPLVTISNVATHKEAAILPAPSITVHSCDTTENCGPALKVDSQITEIVSTSASSPLKTSIDCGKSTDSMRSPTPRDLERRPSFNKIPTPFSAGKSVTLPRNLGSSTNLILQSSDSLSHNKAKSVSSLLNSEISLGKQDNEKSLIELFAAGTISNKSIGIKINQYSRDSNDSSKAKSASSLLDTESNNSRNVRERSPIAVFAAGTVQNDKGENKMNMPTYNQIDFSNEIKNLESISNISKSTAVDGAHLSINVKNKLNKNYSEIIQNMDCISSAGIHSDGAVRAVSEASNNIVASPGVAKGTGNSSAAAIPSPLSPTVAARCNQDNSNPDNFGNGQLQEAVVECSSDLKQTHICADTQKHVDATQIHRDSSEYRETPAVYTTIAAAATSKTPCGDVSGGGTIQNMAAGGSIIIPLAARDQADDKDGTVRVATAAAAISSVQKQDNPLQHVAATHLQDVSGHRSDSRPGTATTGLASALDTTLCCHESDIGSETIDKDHQYVDLVIGETGEIQSQQGIVSHDAVKQNNVQHISVGATSDKLASNAKTDLLTDCDTIDLDYSQNECQNNASIPASDTGIIKLETDTKNQDENVIDLHFSESNKINDDNEIQTNYITLPHEIDKKIDIPQTELFINEDASNIPLNCIAYEIIHKSEDCNETEQSLNDSLSEGLRAISKSSSFSSKPRGATISNCAALIALTGSTPLKPPSHFPMDIICQSKKQVNARQRLATTLGEPVEPAVVQRRRQSSLGHVDPNQFTEKESHSERSRSASRIGYRHSVAIGETCNVPPFDLKQKQKSESHTNSNKDIRKLSPGPPQHSKPPFVRGKSFDNSSDTQKKNSELPKNNSKDTEKCNKTETLPTKSRMKQTDSRTMSPLPPIRAKKNVNKESDDNKQSLHDEKKTTEVFHKENMKEVQLPLIHRLVNQNMEDLSREKEMEMSQDLEDLQREKALESIVTQSETQIPLSQPMENKVEVSTHIFTKGECENMGNTNVKIEVCERPTCIPSIEVLDGSNSIDSSKKISLDSEDINKNNVKTEHWPTVPIPIIIETKADDSFQQNVESGPSSLDQSQDEIFEAALEIAEPTPAFSNSSTSITTVISVESSTPTSVTPTPALEPEIIQKVSTDEENEERFEDASDQLKEIENSNNKYDFKPKVKSQNCIVEQSLRKSSSPCAEIVHHERSPKALDEPILVSEEGSVSSGGIVTDPEMLASASASLSPASSWNSNGGGPVARRDYPLDEDEEELRWKALLAANEIENESGNDGCVSGEDFDAMDEEMRRLEEKLKIFENELGDSAEPSCPSDTGKTSSSTSSRPLFKPEDIEGLRISPLPKVYPPPNMNRTKHFSLMSKMEIEQYGESETESDDNSDNCSDDSADFLYVKKKLKLKPGDRRWRSQYLIRPKDLNVLNSNRTSIDVNKIENNENEELHLSGIVSQNDHNDTFDEGFNDKVDIVPPQEFSESYEIPVDNHLKLDKIQEEQSETESIGHQYEGIGDEREESIMFYGNEEEPLFGCMWNDDDGMTAVDFDIPEELQNYSGQGALFFIFEDDLDEPESVDPADYYITEETPQICEPKYIENVKEKEKSPKQKDSERTFVSAFKNSLRKASKYLGPKIDTSQKKRSRSASASRNKHEHHTEDVTTKNMHLLPAPDNVPERRRSAALDDYKDYSGVYNVRSGIARPNCGPTSDSEGPEISCSSGEYYASPALCVNTSDEDPSLVLPPPPNIPPPPLPPVPPPRWSRWEPTESPQSAGTEYGCWFENTQTNSEAKEVPGHSTECNPNLDSDEMQFYLVGIPQNVQGNVYEDVQVTIEPEIIDSEQISVEQINTGAVYGEPYVKMTGWDPENCCDYEYIDTLACVDPVECIQQPLDCRGDDMSYSVAQPFAQSHKPTSVKQLKRKQHEKAQRQEVEEGQINHECNTCDGVPVKRGRPAEDESSHGRQVSPHPKAIGDRRSWPPRVSSTAEQFYWSLPYLPWCLTQVLDGQTPNDGEILIATSSLYFANLTPNTYPSSACSESPISTSRDPYSESTPHGSTEPTSASSSDSEPYWTPSRRGLGYQEPCQEFFQPVVYSVISPSNSLIYSPSSTHSWNLLTSVEPCWIPVDNTTPTAKTNITANTTKDLSETECHHYDSSGTCNTNHDYSRLDLQPYHCASITLLDWSTPPTKSPLIGVSPCYSCPLLLFTSIGDLNSDFIKYDDVIEKNCPTTSNMGVNQVPSHGLLIQSSSTSSVGLDLQILRYSASESEVQSSGVDIEW